MKAKQAGKVRAIGIAGGTCEEIVPRFREIIDVVQMAESDWNGATFVPDFTYGAISGARAAPENSEPGVKPACSALRRALMRRPEGSVLVGTSRIDHLRQLAECSNY
jgi:aryl-alcohol dehydrogenase-like predicted oxidoreductase